MRRYTIRIDDRNFVVDVDDIALDHFRVAVDGQRFDVALTGQQELSVASITPQIGASAPAAAVPRRAGPPPVPADAALPGLPTGAAPASAAGPPAASGAQLLVAPMPGVILRVAVAAGSRVQRGQDIVVLEAMKMENIIRAPRAGLVAEVLVVVGQQVGHGQPLVRYDAGAA